MGKTRAPTTFDDDELEEARFLKDAQSNQTALGFFWVARLQAAYLLGDYEAARQSLQVAAGRVVAGNIGMITTSEHVFYTALVSAAGQGGRQVDQRR